MTKPKNLTPEQEIAWTAKETARNKRWRAANPEKAAEGAKRWRAANKNKVAEKNRIWRENRPTHQDASANPERPTSEPGDALNEFA